MNVPGTVVFHSPARTGIYVGSPGLAVLPGGTYLASCDEFGPGSTEWTRAVTRVFRSDDRGATWRAVARIDGQFWSSLFVHRGAAYLLGVDRHDGAVVIRRSADGGGAWTEPRDGASGRLRDDSRYHGAPTPVIEHGGRLWRGMEDREAESGLRAFALSAPAGADLLRAGNWISTNRLASDPGWLGGRFRGWLEGNPVPTPEGGLANLMRVNARDLPEQAALVRIAPEGRVAAFDPARDFVEMPGGGKKFTVRRDAAGLYWALTNAVAERDRGGDPERTRNTLALLRSADLRRWEIRAVLLSHPHVARVGFQYVDWRFDGEDMIVLSRTAFEDGEGGAHSQHDANFLTFHRFAHYQRGTMPA